MDFSVNDQEVIIPEELGQDDIKYIILMKLL